MQWNIGLYNSANTTKKKINYTHSKKTLTAFTEKVKMLAKKCGRSMMLNQIWYVQ